MKRSLFLLFFFTLIMSGLSAQEMQLSFGPEAALLTYEVDSDIALRNGTSGYFYNEKTNSLLFAPGINFSMRVFDDNNARISRGYFFRDRAVFVTNMMVKGKGSFNGTTFNINETHSVKDMNSFISIMDFDFGTSSRFKISKRWEFYADLGLNLTIMDSKSDNSEDTLNYVGAGIFANLAFQLNLTKMLYLELGMPATINFLSSQKGTLDFNPFVNKTVKYKDSGRFDFTSSSFYINIGWRIDLDKIRAPVNTHPANTYE